MNRDMRFAVYTRSGEEGWRFNACFPFASLAKAEIESDWYRARGYEVAILLVPDTVAKYDAMIAHHRSKGIINAPNPEKCVPDLLPARHRRRMRGR